MAKIYLSHSTQFDNVGAGDYGTEASEMIELTGLIAYHLRRQPASYGFTVRVNEPGMTLAQTIADSNAWGADIHEANHSNAGGAQGTEAEAYGPGTNSDKLARCIYNRVAPISPGNPDRGVKYNPRLWEVGDAVHATACLVEHVFHDNLEEAMHLKNNKDLYAQATAAGICDYFGVKYVEVGQEIPQYQPAPQVATPATQPVVKAPTGFSYPNNARVVGDFLYVRDANGNQIPGRYVANGDNITVLDVSYSKQLALVEYPTPSGVRSGYVKNVPSLIKYYNQGAWHNGSTPENVLDEVGNKIGSISPQESATPLYRKNGKLHVVYNTDKGQNTKSGYVNYDGKFTKF